MSKIKIKNFGPIKEGFKDNDGWMDIKKITIFIGNQGSGKSSVTKLISTFTWIEKALTRGNYNNEEFTANNRFRKNYCKYHKIDNYFFDLNKKDIAEIEYEGDSYKMKYKEGKFSISPNLNGKYQLPQIMYVPAERNFISAVKSPKVLKLNSAALIEFVSEFDEAKNEIKGSLRLPINNIDIEYNKSTDILNIKGNDYKVRLTEASSGYQSLVPLYLVSWFLANSIKRQTEITKEPMSSDELQRYKKGVELIWADNTSTDEQKRASLSVLSSKFNKSAFINIVEEPEQNLFPSSQRDMLNSLTGFNNMIKENKLIITTHSPYIINYLTLAVKAHVVYQKTKSSNNINRLESKVNEIVPISSSINPNDLIIYELNDNGSIIKLEEYKGLPSDENYLNNRLEEFNNLFANLIKIEDECQ